MTYCTTYWCLEHMRDKRNLEYPRCRMWLDSLVNSKAHNCLNIVRCAQSNGNHYALPSECERVTEY